MVLTVARPIEQAIMEVPGIRRVRSRTFRGATEISAQFEPSSEMISALQQVQNRVAEIRDTLPADVELTIDRLTPAAFPVFSLNLTGGLAPADLHDEAFYVIRPALARVPGVGNALYQAILRGENATVVSFVTVMVLIYLIVNLVVDLVYGLLDPRIRLAAAH